MADKKKLFLVEFKHPRTANVRVMVKAIGPSAARRAALTGTLTVRKVDGIEALDLAEDDVPIIDADTVLDDAEFDDDIPDAAVIVPMMTTDAADD
jgi:hypothetical protein